MDTITAPITDFDRTEEQAEWGLRRYVQRIATGLGTGLEGACCEAANPGSVYLALDRCLPGYPGRDVALFWDASYGWAVGIETASGEDLIVVSYLGGDSLLADPDTVVVFVKTLLAGQGAGQSSPPVFVSGDLTSKLANYGHPPAG